MKLLLKKEKQSKLFLMSTGEIQDIMDSEFEKPVDEIDADIIVLCSDILHQRHENEKHETSKQHKPKKTAKKVLAIAAVLSIVVVTFLFSFADTSEKRIDLNHITLESYKDKAMTFNITNMDKEPDGYFLPETEVLSRLRGNGIETLVLPEVLVNGEYEIYEIKGEYHADNPNSCYRSVHAKFVKPGVSGEVHILKNYRPINEMENDGQSMLVTAAEEFTVNGLDVLVLERKNTYYSLTYYDSFENTSYDIMVYGSYEETVKMLESIK